MSEIYYIYPFYLKGSFYFISKTHIKYLKSKTKIQEIDVDTLDNIMWVGGKNVLIHPVGYTLLGERVETFNHRIKRLYKIKNVAKRLGGFDTADSDKISNAFVDVINKHDFVIVPSTFAKNSYITSGVETDVHVLPHGVNDSFMINSKKITHDTMKQLLELKKKHNAKLVLFFLLHSGFRKGADLVARAMSDIQQEYDNVFLVVKAGEGLDPYLGDLLKLKTILVKGWLSDDELRQLYDVCDVCVCPSRGGGFELNALEGIARGLPTLVTDAMCFKDYISYTVPVKVKRKVIVLPNNPLHVGYGYEVDVVDFTKKLKHVLDNLSKYKRQFGKYAKVVRRKYSWKEICNKLIILLEQYGFDLGG